jgi:hypothetical protein
VVNDDLLHRHCELVDPTGQILLPRTTVKGILGELNGRSSNKILDVRQRHDWLHARSNGERRSQQSQELRRKLRFPIPETGPDAPV